MESGFCFFLGILLGSKHLKWITNPSHWSRDNGKRWRKQGWKHMELDYKAHWIYLFQKCVVFDGSLFIQTKDKRSPGNVAVEEYS
ncbi:hypothetical protein XELAEV_18008778mg [Xenopus laevis]|uniref:Uncharacterized protein n=1 Tax=Xenopus laevis TaxID=8355 RepID=A0A974HZT3_XENLA|nr:hypothetical protein XELAEV_18008778mg [Xenopus laevis]